MRAILSTATWFGAKVEHDLRSTGTLVTAVSDAGDLLACLDLVRRAAILIETDLPDRNWLSLFHEIRNAQPAATVIALSESQSVTEDIAILSKGVDDILTPRMSADEVRARVLRVMTRRAGFATSVLRAGALTIDTVARRAFWASNPLHLTPSQYEVLEHLVLHKERLVDQNEMMGLLYGIEEGTLSCTLHVFVHSLRCRMAQAGAPKDVIHSVKGRGYCLVTPERREADRAEGYDWLTFLSQAA
ncbi:Two component transcriptional regulator, winged helix family [Sulfitobacter noctilucae]|uniref:winged helix-turn-helix domain-containing protein n=1 Tax=Sulfitobacter noctilucae TaxID=1342302 RepID=UPI000562248A|nr:response regulator transcription factor [Sulfitobacter noctilucae]KIN65484.1 Two component transcriptional regulator, winged helix family [Sulfitobacter noctilucae]